MESVITEILQSEKLKDVNYEIRGPVLDYANFLEQEGQQILKLNIGNPGAFGFDAPDEIIRDVIHNLREAQGYSQSKGIFTARKAVVQSYQSQGVSGIDVGDIIMGNGVSELIVMAMQGLINQDDEVLIPAPDYPLWTAATAISGGKPVHYLCDENSHWEPNISDIENKITARTKAVVVINPNNPTGAVYSEDILQQIVDLAEKHNLCVFADEIYDRIIYDQAIHYPLAKMVHKTLCLTFNGLSKAYRLAGFRSGWMLMSGDKSKAKSYIEGLEMLASMRLCANVPAMLAVQTALGGKQSINDLVKSGGRLAEQRDLAYKLITDIPGVTCVKPSSAMYLFFKLDPNLYPIQDDENFVLQILKEKKLLLVQGSAFNYPDTQHLRFVFLPDADLLKEAVKRLSDFLRDYLNQNSKVS